MRNQAGVLWATAHAGGAMYCSKCGAKVAEGAVFCAACGTPVSSSAGEPANAGVWTTPDANPAAVPSAGWPAPAVGSPVAYAGFWLRFVAIIIDGILLYFVRTIVLMPFGIRWGMHGWHGMFHGSHPQDLGDLLSILRLAIRVAMITTIIQWLYYSLTESSRWQATLGKKALGLTVTDLEGRRISFGRATGRYFAKYLSTLILGIGWLMAGFTEKKQALHDMIAGTLVLRKL
jgi:uncharacterized RDD family membrane protein YckC